MIERFLVAAICGSESGLGVQGLLLLQKLLSLSTFGERRAAQMMYKANCMDPRRRA